MKAARSIVLGDEAELGRLLDDRVDPATSRSFPIASVGNFVSRMFHISLVSGAEVLFLCFLLLCPGFAVLPWPMVGC